MTLQLRHRLVVVWLGTIVLAVAAAAGLFLVLLLDFHQANAQARLLEGYGQLQQRLDELAGLVRQNGRRFAVRRDVISSLSMIHRYQDPAAYRPLVFDPEKKHLADELSGLVQAAGLSRGVLYAGGVPVAAYSAGRAGYLTYDAEGEAVFRDASRDEAGHTRQAGPPGFMKGLFAGPPNHAATVQLRLDPENGALVMEGGIPILRDRGGGRREPVGRLVLTRVLDQDFIDEVSRRMGLALSLGTGRLPVVGRTSLPRPPPEPLPPELSRLVATPIQPLWISNGNYFAGAVRLPLAQGGEARLVLGLDKEFLTVEIHAVQLAMLVGLLMATTVILGVGLFYLRRVLSRPLEQLLRGIESVSGGRFVPVEGGGRDDELGHVADAFNTMAAKLEAKQRELHFLNEELEQRVRTRTAELVQARDSAEAANRAKSLFLSTMSHELRTPLNAILGFAQLMRHKQNLTAEQRRDLATINNSGQHLLALINDVLEISRIESGRLSLEPRAFNLRTLLTTVEEMIRVRADKEGLALHAELADTLPAHVEGDEHRLGQILINLLGNAVKYTDSGWVALRVSSEAGGAIRFEIEDSGAGIGEDDRRRIFEPFFQTAGGVAKGEGTGLGLAISHEYVALMGGELQVESRPGHGTLFHFSIPLQAVEAPASTAAVEERRVIGLQPGQRSYRILVVEDNEDNRRLLCRMLDSIGLTVREAADGRQAVEQFQQWHPHLVWMDMRMPVMDGYEATRRIKVLPAAGGTPVVALTASAFEEDRAEVLAAGCDDFVRKPITEGVIYAVLKRHLGLRYRYSEEEDGTPAVKKDTPPRWRVQRLPEELRVGLHDRALELDTEGVAECIGRIEEYDGGLAEALRGMQQEYRFEDILNLLSQEQTS